MQQQTIFVVDDSDTNLAMVAEALEDEYNVITLPSAVKLFAFLEKKIPNLILLDVEMPGIDGYEAIKRLKENHTTADIPVIFLTGLHDYESEAKGIELGAVDFIAKPFSKTVLLNRLKNHLNIDGLIRERTRQLSERTKQLFLLHNNIVSTLAQLVESRDANTGGHIERTTAYLKILANALLQREIYFNEVCKWDMESFISAARLHDLGKISVSDSILNKPASLTNEEFGAMKKHPAEGERIIAELISRTGESGFLYSARLTAAYHHEKWDGTGYPYGLAGTDIPLEGRLMAISDVYDALTSERPYKKAFAHEKAVSIICEGRGTAFDPTLVDVFVDVADSFAAAASTMREAE